MEPLYTETLEELLENQHYGGAEQSAPLTEIITLMGKFPAFIFGETISFNMLDLFIEKYDIREIGAETEQLFMHFWREKTNELLVKYVPKMKMWLNHFNDLFKFSVQLQVRDTLTTSNNLTGSKSGQKSNTKIDNGDIQNTYYLNPVSTTTSNLKVTDVDRADKHNTITDSGSNSETETKGETGTKNRNITKDVLQTVWGKTRADILNKILEVHDVFNECLFEFETIFMGVL